MKELIEPLENIVTKREKVLQAYLWGLENKDSIEIPHYMIHTSEKQLAYGLDHFVRNRFGKWNARLAECHSDMQISLAVLAGLNNVPSNFLMQPDELESHKAFAEEALKKFRQNIEDVYLQSSEDLSAESAKYAQVANKKLEALRNALKPPIV